MRHLTSTGLGSPDLWLLWMHRFTCSAGKLLFINHEPFQTIYTVRLHLKRACLNQEECSRRKDSILWITKRHILQKRSNEAALVYGITSTAYRTTLSSADWHANTKDVLISFCEDRITAFLLANKLCRTVVNTPRPLKQQMHLNLAVLACCDPHTRSVHQVCTTWTGRPSFEISLHRP